MGKRLTSFLRNRTAWSSLAKAAAATGLLILVVLASFHASAIALAALVLTLGYALESPPRRSVRTSFVLAALLGLLGAAFFVPEGSGEPYGWAAYGVLFAVFFAVEFGLFGLMDLSFARQRPVYATIHTILLFGVGAAFFSVPGAAFARAPVTLGFAPLAVFVVVLALSHEFLTSAAPALRGRLPALAGALGLVAGELFLVLRFLPLGFVNAAVLFALLLTLAQGALAAHLAGALTSAVIFRSLTLLTVIFVLVLAFSKWSV